MTMSVTRGAQPTLTPLGQCRTNSPPHSAGAGKMTMRQWIEVLGSEEARPARAIGTHVP